MKITLETTIDPEVLAKSLRVINNATASRQWLNDFISALDTDSYCFVGGWIKDNPVSSEVCACGRRTIRLKSAGNACEYCHRSLS